MSRLLSTLSMSSSSSSLYVAVRFSLLLSFACLSPTHGKEYCHNDEFTAECEDGYVILMTSAQYGRMSIGPCVKTDFGFVGCYRDVIAHAHERCSGRRSCSIRVPDATLDMTNPCNEDLKSYLDVSYNCVKVAGYEEDTCTLTATTHDTVGYLSNRRPSNSPTGPKLCGTDLDPWVINVLPGQRINITQLDFSTFHTRRAVDRKGRSTSTSLSPPLTSTTPSVTVAPPCDRYAVIDDTTERVEVCATYMLSRTASHTYTSTGTSVKIALHHLITGDEPLGYNFLLKYEAIGCPDLSTPQNGWLKRQTNQNQMTAGCHTTGVTWTLECVGTEWQGTAFNCSLVSKNDGRTGGLVPALSMGASLLIILIVSLAIGLIIILFGIVFMKQRRNRNSGAHQLETAGQLRDLKPLNSPDAVYDADGSGVYARNAAFEPSSRRSMPPPVGVDNASMSSIGQHHHPQQQQQRGNDNEYEYVWDAAAVRMHGQPGKTTPVMATAGRRDRTGKSTDRCSCMASSSSGEHVRTMPRNTGSSVADQQRCGGGEKIAMVGRRGTGSGIDGGGVVTSAGPRPATLGRFGHLESRSASRGNAAGSGTGSKTQFLASRQQQQSPHDDGSRRICPHCGHTAATSSTPGSECSPCGAGTPPGRSSEAAVAALSQSLPRRQPFATGHRRT